MSFLEILDTLFLGPLKLLFELIFKIARDATDNLGLSIFILSIAINLLVLPLYMCADAMQERTQKREAELAPYIKHIKKTFKGDERMMMLQTYYKQNDYSPLSALSGAVSLLLEIPFFIAAYTFLSGVAEFQGASLGPIADLSKPDGLLTIGSLTINVLPFIMTIFNIVASVLFLKGAPLKAKIQLYAMAAFFLVFLYNSPSGLLLYWTLNNLFSLIKNLFYKFKEPKTVLVYVISAIGVLIPIIMFAFSISALKIRLLSLIVTVILQIPLAIYWLRKKGKFLPKEKEYTPNKKSFFLASGLLAVVIGILIPSVYIAASPTEFINYNYYVNPLWYILSSACLAIGTFLIWFSVFYWLASPKGKVRFEKTMWILAVVAVLNYMAFGRQLGNISSALQYDNGIVFSTLETILNILAIVAIIVGAYFLITKFKTIVTYVMAIAIAAVGTMSFINVIGASGTIKESSAATQTQKEKPSFELSTTGQNVIVLMLDRAFGEYVPYILNEKPELNQTYSGFTYYNNVISFGGHTNYATPALLGGYEYTPVELNKRDDQSLASKQNEANLLLPRVFTEQTWANGITDTVASVFDPVYTNYKWVADLSVFEEYENVKADNIIGAFGDEKQNQAIVENNFRNFFCFSLMKVLPTFIQTVIYNDGQYNVVYSTENEDTYSVQATDGLSKSNGIRALFMDNYNNIVNLDTMTKITDTAKNTYMFMANNLTHEAMMLDEANGYIPAKYDENADAPYSIDNTEYDTTHADRFTLKNSLVGKDVNLKIETAEQMMTYQTNMAALLRVGEWLNFLKEYNVYDNTKIIIVSDHAFALDHLDELTYSDGDENVERYFPLLLVKDFDASGNLKTDSAFMTNADVPYLATQGAIVNAKNPYTDAVISNTEKTAHPQFIIRGTEWSIYLNNGNAFDKAIWASIDNTDGNGNIWDEADWQFHNSATVRDSHDR